MQPIIAVVADVREFEHELWHAVPDQYLIAVNKVAGLLPVFVPALGEDIDVDQLLVRMDGVLLTGSKAHVHPSNYGGEPRDDDFYDLARDTTTLPLIRAAIERGVPLLALCRGIQELNVALGGTVRGKIHEAGAMLDHRAEDTRDRDKQFKMSHVVSTTRGGCIEDIIGPDPLVNSLHEQAVDIIAPRLQVEAVADDSTVEAVSVVDAKGFAIGVQWHPEYWAETDTPSRKLFEAFGNAVRAYMEANCHQTVE